MDPILAIPPELAFQKASTEPETRGVDEEEFRQVLARENVGRPTAEAAGELLSHLQALAEAGLVDADLDNLLCDLLGRVRAVLHVESLAILLPTDDGRAFAVRTALDNELVDGARLPILWDLVGRIVRTRRPIAVDGPRLEVRPTSRVSPKVAVSRTSLDSLRLGPEQPQAFSAKARGADITSALGTHGVQALLGVPLLIEGRAIGILQIGTRQPRQFTEGEVLLLQLSANRMALVIERATERNARAAAAAAHMRSALLADTSALLDGSLGWENSLESVARLAVPTLGDWCIVDVVESDQSVRRLSVAYADPADAEVAYALKRQNPPNPSETRTSDHAIALPLQARGRILGAVSFLHASDRRYGVADLQSAKEVAHRMAMALDNARLYEETQRAVRVRDEFLASASHDLRTPLSHIKGFTSTLLQTEVEWDESSRREFLVEIVRATDRLDKLIGDLLDISRIESGGLDSGERVATAPSALVAGGLDRVQGLLEERSIEVDVAADLPLVAVDPTQLERVVANLVENAAKYSPSHGVIQVKASCRDNFLEMRVEDEGPGIPADQLDQIFEKFHRAQSAARPGVSGTGLGLAICRGIVRAHAGRIRAENRDEGGARFIVQLPLANEQPGCKRAPG
jgi:signal transduction histidine kinase